MAENLGARLSGLEATMTALEKYEHERWHKLAQDLQPLVILPERMAREMGKIQGAFEGRIGTISRDIERSITAAVEKAIAPVNEDIATLKADVETLKSAKLQQDGERGIIAAICKSPALAWLAALVVAAWAVLSGKGEI